MNKASLFKRILNFHIDVFFILLITATLILLLVEFSPYRFPSVYLYLIVFLLYYVTSEAFFGKTIAKVITKTKVVCKKDSNMFYIALVRTLCRLIPFEPVSFVFGRNGSFWHDQISGSTVISVT